MTELKCPKCGAVLTVDVSVVLVGAKNKTVRKGSIDDIKTLFPKDLEEMLTFEDSQGYIIVKPRQYLGSDNFSKIASIIREAGGEYISAGKQSHFRIPKQ